MSAFKPCFPFKCIRKYIPSRYEGLEVWQIWRYICHDNSPQKEIHQESMHLMLECECQIVQQLVQQIK